MPNRFSSPPVAVLGFAVLFLAAPTAGQCADYSWNSGITGNWNEPARWTIAGGGSGVPGSGDNATIAIAGTYTVNLTDNRSITTLSVNRSTATLDHTDGTLTVGGAGAFHLTAGTYNLFTWADDGVHGHQWVGTDGGTGAQAKGRLVTVRSGRTTAVPPVRLDRAGTITGMVTEYKGRNCVLLEKVVVVPGRLVNVVV